MDRPAPCDAAVASTDRSPKSQEGDAPPRALRHYDHAIEALAGATYEGLSAAERRALLVALCREKQRLVRRTPEAS